MAQKTSSMPRRSPAPAALAGGGLLVVLCVMTALPPAVYAGMPEASVIIEAAAAKEAQRRESARLARAVVASQRARDAARSAGAPQGLAILAASHTCMPAPARDASPPLADAGERARGRTALDQPWLIDTPPPAA